MISRDFRDNLAGFSQQLIFFWSTSNIIRRIIDFGLHFACFSFAQTLIMAETDPKSVQDLTAVVSFKRRVAKLGEARLG